jgi:hypothetical protein
MAKLMFIKILCILIVHEFHQSLPREGGGDENVDSLSDLEVGVTFTSRLIVTQAVPHQARMTGWSS